jgi:hypothetical protein
VTRIAFARIFRRQKFGSIRITQTITVDPTSQVRAVARSVACAGRAHANRHDLADALLRNDAGRGPRSSRGWLTGRRRSAEGGIVRRYGTL